MLYQLSYTPPRSGLEAIIRDAALRKWRHSRIFSAANPALAHTPQQPFQGRCDVNLAFSTTSVTDGNGWSRALQMLPQMKRVTLLGNIFENRPRLPLLLRQHPEHVCSDLVDWYARS
jgi:hypothetical protein